MNRITLINADVRVGLAQLPEESVHCVVTSVPYWGLRDYGLEPQVWMLPDEDCPGHEWGGEIPQDSRHRYNKDNSGKKHIAADEHPKERGNFCRLCGAWRGSYGLEPALDCLGWATGQPCGQCYICHSVQIFREVRRVLRKDGTLWLNIGDTYVGGGRAGKDGIQKWGGLESKNQNRKYGPPISVPGLKPKNLCLVPFRLALALQADGWWMRSDIHANIIIWAKPNPMPESCTDRPTKAHEYIFLLTKSAHYFWDQEAVREEGKGFGRSERFRDDAYTGNRSHNNSDRQEADKGGGKSSRDGSGRNLRTVWEIATAPFPEAHFACVDAETEALTPTGWKTHNQLSNGDLIAGYDQENHTLSWQPAEFWAYQVNCKLVKIEKRDSSQRLTENHRCLIRRRIGGEAVVLASDLKPGMEIPIIAPLLVTETEGPGADFAALLGWYLTEGEQKRHRIIRINQSMSANPEKVEMIRDLLVRLGAEFNVRRREREIRGKRSVEVTFSIWGEIAEYLHRESPDKKIDLFWVNWPLSDIQSLFDAMIAGDGHRRKDGRSCIVQKDRGFLDAVQMLALRLGLRTIISPRKEGGFILYITKDDWLTLRGTNGVHAPVGREHYKGTIWCPSVVSTFWIARRKGRTFITGNTFPPAIPERCIKAGTSEKGCCPKCGAPWKRVVEKKYRSPLIKGDFVKKPNCFKGDKSNPRERASDGTFLPRPYFSLPGNTRDVIKRMGDGVDNTTTGWTPTCAHYPRTDEWREYIKPKPGKKLTLAQERENESIRVLQAELLTLWEPMETLPCVCLDPFAGAGTTCLVAAKLGRGAIGIELSPKYVEMSASRIKKDLGMLVEVEIIKACL